MVRVERPPGELDVYDPVQAAPWTSGASPAEPWSAGQRSGQSLFSMIDDRMRGRWKWAAMLGLVLAVGLGLYGYDSAAPLYQSVGAIRIVFDAPVVRAETPEHRKTPAQVQTQIEFLRIDRVLQNALKYPQLAALPFSKRGNAVKVMANDLEIKPAHESEIIFVSFADEDPRVAQAVVNGVLHSYNEIYGKHGGVQINTTLNELSDHMEMKEREQRRIRDDLNRIINKYDTDNLRELQNAKSAKVSQVEAHIAALNRALRRMEGVQTGAEGDESIAPPLADLEKLEPNLAVLRQQYEAAENTFKIVKSNYEPDSFRYITAEKNAQTALAPYREAYFQAVKKWQKAGGESLAMLEGACPGATSSDQIRQCLGALANEQTQLKAETQQLTRDIQAFTDLREQEDSIKQDLKDTQARIGDLKIESPSLAKQITIEQEGYLPSEPYSDARNKRGIAGVAVGLLGSFGLFFLWGTVDRRAYGARQLHLGPSASALPPCLGVLPDLGRSLRDQETSDVAAHCVHQIRNQIEARRDSRRGYVLALTSPFQGDGKTSIIMALGWSYAAAGFKTLMIDCDMVGRSLTRQLGLVGQEGLKEALLAQQMNGSVVPTAVEHLSALPVGADTRFGPENLKRSDLEQLLAAVRDQFDIVLIDTGPMLGSLESTPVTAAADGVVLSVRRGRSRTRLEECVSRLENVGAQCLGVILNYAVRSDCNRYVSEASLAAAEDGRGVRSGDPQESVLHTVNGERNALMLVMERSNKTRTDSAAFEEQP